MARTRHWSNVHSVEDALALLADLYERVHIIQRKAQQGVGYDSIFDEATEAKSEVAALQRWLGRHQKLLERMARDASQV